MKEKINIVQRTEGGKRPGDTVIKKFEKPKGWLSKKISGSSENQIETLVQLLEERSIWQKYGL